ncbi:MAG: N-formylglutamate amidohydrolase [Planctomycetes bacterium]|nr:N-formylglutamate amidohydrolase [Planctomycetota bacterium]
MSKVRPRGQIVVTVEHATSRVPEALAGLGLPRTVLESHVGWDPGTASVGRILARAFDAPLHLGKYSRLVADLNRSHDHPRVVARDLRPSGRRVPGNDLDRAERIRRLERYWHPWRRAVDEDLDAATTEFGAAFHISVHSFVERLGGQNRNNDIGLLYDPKHRAERVLADRLDERLSAMGYRVRRNFPYRGIDDGHCMRQRKHRRHYVGMEIEMNQRQVRHAQHARRFGHDLVEAFAPEFDQR